MSKIVGIDLGTTNSLVAVLEGGEPVVITTAEGSRLLNEAEVERMVQDAQRSASEDNRRRETIQARNEAEQAIYQTGNRYVTWTTRCLRRIEPGSKRSSTWRIAMNCPGVRFHSMMLSAIASCSTPLSSSCQDAGCLEGLSPAPVL